MTTKTIEEKPDWEKEIPKAVKAIFALAHVDFDNDMAAAGIEPPEYEAYGIIHKLLSEQKKEILEMIPKKLDENWRRTEQEPTKDEQTFIEGFNACIAELRNKIKSLNSSKIIEE